MTHGDIVSDAPARGWSLQRSLPAIAWALVFLAVTFGVTVRVLLRGTESLWLDELWTLDAVSRPYKEMVGSRLVSDQSPPVWTSLTWVWLRTVRTYDSATMRTLATMFSLVAVAAPLAGAVRMRALRAPLLVMAGLFALSLFAVQFAVELRSYTFAMAMGSIATVLWAGLMTGELPRTGRWILAFTFSGAIGGFAHYYGNLLYASLLLVLVLAWLARPPRRPLYVLLAWATLSFVPVVTWYLVTRRWSPGTAVASPPSVVELKRWTQYSFAPLTSLLSDQAPASVDGSSGTGAWIAIAVVLVLLVALLAAAARRRRPTDLPTSPSVVLGSAAVAVTALGIVAAWSVSLMLPPSMNTRNLAALVPALFLATGCATTVARRETVRWATAVLVLAAWSGSAAVYAAQHGVTSLSPPWQASAGYAATAKMLVQSQQAPEPPRLVGLQQPWAWHGDWDAVVRAEIGSGPALATGPGPLPVVWVMDDQDPRLTTVPRGPLIVFGYADDPRDTALVAWANRVDGPCDESRLGTPGFGNILVATCGGV